MRTLILSIATIYLISLFSCSGEKREKKNEPEQSPSKETIKGAIKENFEPVLDDFIDLLEQEHSDTTVVIVICYHIFDNGYILLGNDFGYKSKLLKGYTEYRNYLICYYGVDDYVARKIFDFDNLKKANPDGRYNKENLGGSHFEPTARRYHIDNQDSIIPYEPTPIIEKEMVKLSIKHGIVPPPPPPPEP